METNESSPADRYMGRHMGGLTTGLVIIAIGVFFLLNNFGFRFAFMEYQNWWALFILIGAVGPLGYAVQRYRRIGKVDGAVLHSLISTAAIVTVACLFLFDLDWGLWWPLFIIYGGLYTLANSWKRGSRSFMC